MPSSATYLYPAIRLDHIQNPSRFYAVPIIGILAKFIMCIPIFFEFLFLGIANFFVTFLINPFYVLFTAKYWEAAYDLNLGLIRLSAKLYYYFAGLTNKYPGLDFTIDDPLLSLDLGKPQTPNKLYAIPFLGGFIRLVLLIPFYIYSGVIGNGAGIGVLISSFPVLFIGEYPESTYEMGRDGIRLNLALSAYFVGLSDSYPSFWISMNHKAIKITLIVLGALSLLGRGSSSYHYTYPPKSVVQPKGFNQYTPGLQTQ
jgi:hypothetical protein